MIIPTLYGLGLPSQPPYVYSTNRDQLESIRLYDHGMGHATEISGPYTEAEREALIEEAIHAGR